MDRKILSFTSFFAVCLFVFILLQGAYTGFTNHTVELDSKMYHIPIAKSYFDGSIFSSPDSPILHRFFPGAAEGILALFILFGIPIHLFNVGGVLCLGLTLYLLGKQAGLKTHYSILFSLGFAGLNGITRWMNVQIIDIWVAVFYAYAFLLFLKPEKNISYAVRLGIALGLLIGSKYSGPLFACFLFLFFGKKIIQHMDILRLILISIPVLVIGLFWYIRNYIVIGNPVYPIAFLGFPGIANWALEMPVWKAAVSYPFRFSSALISEYLGWSLGVFLLPVIPIYVYIRRKRIHPLIIKLVAVTLCNLFVYMMLPNGDAYTVHVSNLRYSYPVMIPLMLGVFLFFQNSRYMIYVSILTFGSLIFSLNFPYHPKLIFIYIFLLIAIHKIYTIK